jgi:hypothetical protein
MPLNVTLYGRKGKGCTTLCKNGHLKWKQFRLSASILGFNGRKMKVNGHSTELLMHIYVDRARTF